MKGQLSNYENEKSNLDDMRKRGSWPDLISAGFGILTVETFYVNIMLSVRMYDQSQSPDIKD